MGVYSSPLLNSYDDCHVLPAHSRVILLGPYPHKLLFFLNSLSKANVVRFCSEELPAVLCNQMLTNGLRRLGHGISSTRAEVLLSRRLALVPPRSLSPALLRARTLSSMSEAKKHTFLVYAPDYTDEEALSRRLAVRGKHLEGAKKLIGSGVLSTSLST